MLKFAERGDFGDDNVEEVNDYYPFGGLMSNTASNGFQPYKCNGKELDREAGLDLYDYGARFYDPAIGRFMTVDPMAEKYYASSPYNYCDNDPINKVDPDGKDGIFIAFPDYKITTPIGKIGGLGHAGVLLINNRTGLTKYYEYGRYDADGKGIVRTFPVPDVKIGQDGIPTETSLKQTLKFVSDKAGHGGRIEGAYVKSDKFDAMKDYAENRLQENNNPQRTKYSLTKNNCGTFAADVLKQDPKVSEEAPNIIDPRPNSMVEEYQKKFEPIIYEPDIEDGI